VSSPGPKVRFRIAYALRQIGKQELRVIVSEDCGFNFLDTIYRKNGPQLATAIPTRDEWTPEDFSEWREESVSLADFAGKSDIVIDFDVINNFGNNFYLDDIEVIDSPINDDCEHAIQASLDSAIEFFGDAEFATRIFPANECSGKTSFMSRDLWYKFVADTNITFIGALGNGDFDMVIELFKDSCGSEILECTNENGPGEAEVIVAPFLEPGVTHFVRVYHFGDFASETTTFSIVVARGENPDNDECVDAINLNIKNGCDPVTGVAAGTPSSPSACSGSESGDIWYSFTATNSELFITVVGQLQFDAVIELWDECDGMLLACQDDAFKGEAEILLAKDLIIGKKYFVRVYDYTFPTIQTAIFHICVSQDPPVLSLPNQIRVGVPKIKIYPNPTNSLINLEFQSNNDAKISISLKNLNGKFIHDEELTDFFGDFTKKIDLSNNVNGVYFLQIKSEHLNISKKIVLIQ